MIDFPHQTSNFLSDLSQNNNKSWFAENRSRYEVEWLEPAKSFVTGLIPLVEQLSPPHKAEPRINGSIKKVHRDVRFSKDKTPYDPKMHLVFWTGDHPNRSPAIHLVLRSDRLGIGAGYFALTAQELENYRETISQNPKETNKLIAILENLKGFGCDLSEETLKNVPKGFTTPNGHETLLKRKGLVALTREEDLPSSKIIDHKFLSEFFEVSAQLNGWLIRNLA